MEASTVSVSKSRTAYVVDDASLLGYGHEQDPPAQKQVKQNRFAALLRNAGLKGPLFARRALLKDPREHGKVIISGDWWTAAARCWVHIIPVCVTIVLAYLNLSGFYIGDDLEGWHSKNSESLKRLMLQGAAKLFELLVVASLATIILDVLRHELMAEGEGVPLGLLFAHKDFAGFGFFFKPEFLSGTMAFKGWWKRIAIMFGLAVCGLVAAVAGPTSALLLIPSRQTNWPAGETDFWISGNSSVIWPETMDSNAVTAKCSNPDIYTITSQRMDFSGCAWAGYQTLVADSRATHQKHVTNLTATDGVITRQLQRFLGVQSFTIAPCVACASFSADIALEWIRTIKTLRGVSSYAHYQRFGFTPPTIRVSGYVPVVRAQCYRNHTATLTNDTWKYPFLPQRGLAEDVWYELPSRPLLNSTAIAMQWRDIPVGPSPLGNGSTTDYYPSAFLDFQIPWGGNLSALSSYLYTCSIDARWVRTDTIGVKYNDQDTSSYYTYAQTTETLWPFEEDSLPATGSIHMNTTWLNNLMPPLNDVQQPGWTTFTSILAVQGLDNIFTDQRPLLPSITSILATYFADGLSRNGYENNGGGVGIADYHVKYWDPYGFNLITGAAPPGFRDTIYRTGYAIPRPASLNDGNSTKLHWAISLGGWAYRADTASYRLALALLFVHVALALAHTAWVLRRGTSSEAWESSAELLVLAQNSAPDPVGLGSTCAGIEQSRTMRRAAHVRVVERDDVAKASGFEQVQLVFGPGAGTQGDRVRVDVGYGQQALAHSRTL